MLTASACSIGPKLPPPDLQARIPDHLLVKPAPAPAIPRTTDPVTGATSVNGEQALSGALSLYDYVGSIYGQLIALIDAETARQAPPPAKKKKGLFGRR